MTEWREEASRALAKMAMENFPTVADAIFELVDNPIDYRRGRKLSIDITVDKSKDAIVVQDVGGEGMDAEGISDWLNWGSGHPHASADIGMYHQGGKAACGYLADSLRLYAKAAGRPEVWKLEDPLWGSRDYWMNWGSPTRLGNLSELPQKLRNCPQESGFVRIELWNLREKRFNLESLRWRLSNTYRHLLSSGAIEINLLGGGGQVEPLKLPLSSAFERRDVRIPLPSGRTLSGWVGRLDRDAVVASGKRRIPGGLRCLFQGRLISEGEFFGYYAEGKGLLASLIGEVHINHIKKLLPNKGGFQTDSPEWEEVERTMSDYLRPIIAEFRRAAERQTVTREERKRAANVRDQLREALRAVGNGAASKSGGSAPIQQAAVAGRKPATTVEVAQAENQEQNGSNPAPRKSPQPRTEPPEGATGRLRRLLRRTVGQEEVPPIELEDASDRSVRSFLRIDEQTGRIAAVVINIRYPLYSELDGAEAYLAETAVMELSKPQEGDQKNLTEYLGEVDTWISAWARVREAAEEREE